MSVYVFACVIGFLWLSTVPLTSGLVAQIFGVHYLSMLGGFVFLGHQIGSFLGVWLGGRLYDMTGSYDLVWWISSASASSPPRSTCRFASSRCCVRWRHEAAPSRHRAGLGRRGGRPGPRYSLPIAGPTSRSTSRTSCGTASSGTAPT